MEMNISFPGGSKINAEFNGFTVATDQPAAHGGEGTAPDPYSYFLASLATCSGIFVLRFCEARSISTEGLGMTLTTTPNPDGKGLAAITVGITLPPDFPEKYEKAVIRAADLCAVKNTIKNPPRMDVVINK